jgi:predicted HicB family RNase H-like nuclease
MPQYTYRAEFSPDEGLYVGVCLEFAGMFARAATAPAAIEAIEQVIHKEVADLEEAGFDPPPSLTDRRYSGRFLVRTSPQLHSRLMVEAAEQRVTLNHLAVTKLAGRDPRPNLDDFF